MTNNTTAALTFHERNLVARLNDANQSLEPSDRNGLMTLIERLSSPRAAVPAAAKLPDGSGFMVASLPLPADHWLYAPRGEWDDERDTCAETPHPILTHAQRDQVVEAVRYAVRGATMCGKESDFDPDALVLNAVYALCGPRGFDLDAAPAAPVAANQCDGCNVNAPITERGNHAMPDGGFMGCTKDRYVYGALGDGVLSGDEYEARRVAAQAVAADGASTQRCNLGVGCDEAGVCYASAHGDASQCGRAAVSPATAEPCAHDYVRSDRVCTECGEKTATADEQAAFEAWFKRSGFWNDAITGAAWSAACTWERGRASQAAAPAEARVLAAARKLIDMRHKETTRDHEIIVAIDALEVAVRGAPAANGGPPL